MRSLEVTLPNLPLLTQQVRQERGKDENSSDI